MFSDENNVMIPKPTELSYGSTEGKEKGKGCHEADFTFSLC